VGPQLDGGLLQVVATELEPPVPRGLGLGLSNSTAPPARADVHAGMLHHRCGT
jgi:hypothetical protein